MTIWLEDGETDLRRQCKNAKLACEKDPNDLIKLKKWAKSALGLAVSDDIVFVQGLEDAKKILEKVLKESNGNDIDTLYYLGMVHVTMLLRDITIIRGDYAVIEELVTDGYKILKRVKQYAEEHPEEKVEPSDCYNASELLQMMEMIAENKYIDLSDKSSSNETDGSDEEGTDKEDLEAKYRINDVKNKITETDFLLGLCDAKDDPIEKIEILAEAITLLEGVLAIEPDNVSAKQKLVEAHQKIVENALGYSLEGAADERNDDNKRTRGEL